MGTDIFYLAEKRVGDHWEPAFETFAFSDPDDPDGSRFLYHEDEFYFGANRNYELYEILAGTIDKETGLTSRGFEPISPPRGYPDDLSDAVRQLWRDPADPKGCNGCYGFSWLLLKELIDFPWKEKERTFVGCADAENHPLFSSGQRFKYRQVSPKVLYSCQDLKDYPLPEWDIVSNEEMQWRIDSGTASEQTWTQITYSRSYAGPGQGILNDTIPKLSKVGPPDGVRVVFHFCC